MFAVLIPVVLMMGKAFADIFASEGTTARSVLDFLGTPLVALLIAVLVGMVTLGRGAGMGMKDHRQEPRDLPAADRRHPAHRRRRWRLQADPRRHRHRRVVADWVAQQRHLGPAPRLGGGGTHPPRDRLGNGRNGDRVGHPRPAGGGLPTAQVSLLVLAIGAGSVFFSHVNDAGFWLVKEYFGLSVGQTFKSWSAMETLLSVTGLVVVLLLGLVV